MHASASWRKRHPHAAVREVENSGSHVPVESTVRCYSEALCQLFNTLLDGDAGDDGSRKLQPTAAVFARTAAVPHWAPAAHCSGRAAMITGVFSPTTGSNGGCPSAKISPAILDQISLASSVISALSTLETGQFFSASPAMRAKAASSRFGTWARSVSADRLMRNPCPSCSIVTAASVVSSVGV